jgi:hypothetical protein
MPSIKGRKFPTPFGSVNLPTLETPPLSLPRKPDARLSQAIRHGLGEDLAQIIALIPLVGDIVADAIEDLHHSEIKDILTPEEYKRFSEYNKWMPTSIAMIRTFCFK